MLRASLLTSLILSAILLAPESFAGVSDTKIQCGGQMVSQSVGQVPNSSNDVAFYILDLHAMTALISVDTGSNTPNSGSVKLKFIKSMSSTGLQMKAFIFEARNVETYLFELLVGQKLIGTIEIPFDDSVLENNAIAYKPSLATRATLNQGQSSEPLQFYVNCVKLK